jgi:FMN reductase
MTTARSIVLVSAGVGQPSSTRLLGDRLVVATIATLEARGLEVRSSVIEVRDFGHDLVDNVVTGFPSRSLRRAVDSVKAADGVIAVSPVYNGSYSGLFKLFFDVLERGSLHGRPLLLGATGGTPRHSLALDFGFRPLFAYLGASAVPTSVFAASADWGAGSDEATAGAVSTAEPRLADRIARAAAELAAAIATGERDAPADGFDAPTTFRELLGGSAIGRDPGER